MAISTIYSRLGREFYLRYFLRHPTCYPYLLQIILRKAHSLAALVTGVQKNGRAETRRFNTPERLRVLETVRRIGPIEVSSASLMQLPGVTLDVTAEHRQERVMISLASQDVELGAGIFERAYADPEDLFAANRFIWLFDLLHDMNNPKALALARRSMLFWARKYTLPCDHPRFESYSISERLIGWLFFLMFTKSHLELERQDADGLADSIRNQLDWLVHHLEYAGEATNNHVLNNARALYISGQLLNLRDVSQLGRQIFVSEYGKVIRHGVYQEGSTHYQFLLTKNLMEIIWVGELTGDTAFCTEFKPVLADLLQTCQHLQPPTLQEIPLIGDISPDLRPAWFVGYPFCSDLSKPSKWFRIYRYDPRVARDGAVENSMWGARSQTEWRQVTVGDFTVFANLRQKGIPGHGHNDNGSISVFFEGRPVVVDLGLASYLGSASDLSQVSTEAHNTPEINGYEPDISKYSALSKSRLCSSYELVHTSPASLEFILNYANERVKLLRKIDVSADGCTITDRVLAAESFPCSYALWWHLPFEVVCASGARFIRGDLELAFQAEGPFRVNKARAFKRSESYGKLETVTSLRFKAEVERNVPLEFTITRKYHEMPL